ncbi:DNA-processing protein DprA [[Pseudomonas] boreopolis]|uniref:DNA-processing protein DprA n=1 Tax=Xanthomonas boreopolis TaxID=86183 RepID=UPI003D4342B0
MDIPPPHDPESTRALLALVLAEGPLAPRRHLLERHGDPRQALREGASAGTAAGCDTGQVARLRQPDHAAIDAILAWRDGGRRHVVGLHDPDYPALLRRTANPPLALFIEGDPALLWHPAIAVVGSRSPSAGGRDHARSFSRAICRAGLAIVSGMAAGIDAAAHGIALDMHGTTVAVLGTGPDVAYPAHHHELRERIAAQGAIVSEYPPGTGPRTGQFPARNRIIAGLALGTLVVEAAHRSGALITARLASEAGREVFAIPGSIHNPMARGCHRLIRDGATLVEQPGDVLDGVAALSAELAAALQDRLDEAERALTPKPAAPAFPDPDYHTLWTALGHDPTPMDSLVERTGLTAATLSSMLLLMELEGRVVVEHGRYARHS